MGRIVVLTMQMHGHVNPTIAVVKELVARGEEVFYYSSDPFKERLEQAGAVYRRYDTLFTQPALQSNPANFSLLVIKECLHVLPQVLDDVRALQPDYILYDTLCITGRFLAQILDLPAIMFFTTHAGSILTMMQVPYQAAPAPVVMVQPSAALPPSEDQPKDVLIVCSNSLNLVPPVMQARRVPGVPAPAFPTQPDAEYVPAAQVAEIQAAVQSAVAELSTTYGLGLSGPSEIYNHAEDLNLVFLPREFQAPSQSFDERFVFVGPSILPQTATTSPMTRAEGRPTLYISLGTLFNDWPEFFAMCFQAFGNSDWQVVMSIGDKVDPAQLGPIPDNFTVAAHVPQLAVLAETDVFITHGGMNSTMEALSYGVPLVVIPQMSEQAVTALRVADLGLGLALEKQTVSVDSLRDATARVLNEPSFRQEAAEMREAIRRSGGYQRAADEILRFIATRLPTQARETTIA